MATLFEQERNYTRNVEKENKELRDQAEIIKMYIETREKVISDLRKYLSLIEEGRWCSPSGKELYKKCRASWNDDIRVGIAVDFPEWVEPLDR